jgi:ABC-type transport system involved in cytochrome bd biosynthesis fused ATPase/permease subunit
MDKGAIVETGIHEELVKRPGIYKKIFNIQSGYGKEKEYERQIQTV